MVKVRRRFRLFSMYAALFLVMFGLGFVVTKSTDIEASALSVKDLVKFSQNNILFYDPGERDDCESTVVYSGNEITWRDLNALSENDRLKVLVRNYGEFAMELQKYYGVPWEVPFAIMVLESNVGADKASVSYRVEQAGYYNMMGLTDGYGIDHYKNQTFSGITIGQNTFSGYDSISQMLLGFFIYHTRNGHKPDTSYDAGLKLLKPDDYRLKDAIADFMSSYCGDPGESEYCATGAGVYEIIRTGEGTSYTGLLDVVSEMGWMNSEQLAKSENIQPGGIATQEWGWGDIRQKIWDAYGEAGLPASVATKFGAITSSMKSGKLVASVGGDSVLHSPAHDWLSDAGLEGYVKNEISLFGTPDMAIDYNVIENGKYVDYADDAGNGSGLPGFIVLHLTSASNFGAQSWTNYTSTTKDNRPIYVPPHFTIDVKERKTFQHFPLSHPSAAVATRTDTADGSVFVSDLYGIQIEIVGHGGIPGQTCIATSCDDEHLYSNFTDDDWEYVAKIMMAISEETGIPLTSSVQWADSYDAASSMKLSTDQLKTYIGVLGHEHINGKWDPLNVWKYIKAALERTDYSYTSENTSTCGAPVLKGKCYALDDIYDGGCTSDGYTFFFQSGKAWKDYPIACGATIESSGCGYAALADIVTGLTGQFVTPIDIVNIARSGNELAFYNCGPGGGSFGNMPQGVLNIKDFGLKFEYHQNNQGFNVDNINTILDSNGGGKSMILFTLGSGPLAHSGHWVVIRGRTSNGKWKMFTSSSWYNGNYGRYDVNDLEFEPSVIVNAHLAWRSYWYVISKE